MSKLQYQPTEAQSSMFYDACKHLAAARGLFRDLAADPSIPMFLEKVCVGAASDTSFALGRFKSIFSKERYAKFEQQVTESDPFAIEQIKEYVRRMNPEQQNIIENICQRLVAGEEIKIMELPNPVTSEQESLP